MEGLRHAGAEEVVHQHAHQREGDDEPQEVVGEVSFRYGEDDVVRAARPGRCFFSTRTSNVVVRDLAVESARAVRLLDLGFVYNPSSHQFTLAADTRRGRRPSFVRAAEPELADALYRRYAERLQSRGLPVSTGTFQAMMDVELVNQGPVTILLEVPAPGGGS